ncbi:MAG: LacI family DNA-binding transcriptional regulator [Clostridiaceae bacterium]
MSISIKDVARDAGVSIATVSRVLNDVDVVNDDTKQRVLDAIKKLGYRPNIVARSLKTQKTKTIGIVVPDISDPFYPEVVRGAEDVANIYDYNIILCNTDLDPEKEQEYLNVLREKMVDGIVLMSSSLNKNIINLTKELKLPTVLVETKDDNMEYPSVTVDNKKAAYDAVSYLINNGNKRIAYLGVYENKMNAKASRYSGYKKALLENGMELDEDLVYFGGSKAKDGFDGILEIISKNDIDAIFCVSDEVAMGAINALREKKIKVPEDVDVIGFDDIYVASIFYPKLSTVSQPMYDMGSVGMRMLIKKINNQDLEEEQFVLDYELKIRESCKKNRG